MRGNLKRHCLSGCFPETIIGLCAQSEENSLLRNKLANNFQGSAGRWFFLTWLAVELFVISNSALDRHCCLFLVCLLQNYSSLSRHNPLCVAMLKLKTHLHGLLQGLDHLRLSSISHDFLWVRLVHWT